MKYQLRASNEFMPKECEAIVFVYSPPGIERAKTFCGDDYVAVKKERHTSAVGELHFAVGRTVVIAREGDFLVRAQEQAFTYC